ncbi:MAG: hypothetical protein EXQ79_03005 [Acidimicrobiia bacterium]|nr:hypothetical protein [Acidimicrobiia bacterium]
MFSQNGEDGVLCEILHRIGPGSRTFVEFGAGDGSENCCSLLADVLGWRGLFAELDDGRFSRLQSKYKNNVAVTTVSGAITPENVAATFRAASVPEDLDVLSIDVDGSDYWIWQALEGYRPRVVIIEYNASLDATKPLVQPSESPGWDNTAYFGASLAAMEAQARVKGYTLVHLELVGANAFFVRDDLLWPDVQRPVLRGPNYNLAANQHFADLQIRSYVDPST